MTMSHNKLFLLILPAFLCNSSALSLTKEAVKSPDASDQKLYRNPREIEVYNSIDNEVVSDGKKLQFIEDDIIYIQESDISVAIQKLYKDLSLRMNDLSTQIQHVTNRLNLIDCYDLKMQQPLSMSGVYTFHLDYKGKRPVSVQCDMLTDGGGWTVIQQRLPRNYANDSKSHSNFNRGAYGYRLGFGAPEGDYWIGLENIYLWTNTRQYELRIHLTDFRNLTGYALYGHFHIEDEKSGYRLHVSDFRGDIGDSLSMKGVLDNFTADGMLFTTHDEDLDTSHEINCASFWNIGGWWYNRCSWANLNGPYKFPGEGDGIGINWHKWRNKQYLKATKMMIRPSKTP